LAAASSSASSVVTSASRPRSASLEQREVLVAQVARCVLGLGVGERSPQELRLVLQGATARQYRSLAPGRRSRLLLAQTGQVLAPSPEEHAEYHQRAGAGHGRQDPDN